VTTRSLESGVAELTKLRRWTVEPLLLLVPTTVALLWAITADQQLVVRALTIGAVAEVVLSMAAALIRREAVDRLALDPRTHAIPEVHDHARRAATAAQRRRTARNIIALINGEPSLAPYLIDRVRAFEHELQAVAHLLEAAPDSFEPSCAVACRRLITRPVDSPLYNPELPAEQLATTLRRIRLGFDVEPA
jgi:hypothetical protein